jgi:methylglutaconyl-CoA hydratase
MYETISVFLEQDFPAVMVIQLNRASFRNALNLQMIQELIAVFSKDALHASVRAVVLQGNGSVFCSGADLNWMRTAASFEENLEQTRILAQLFQTIQQFPKPVLAVAQGDMRAGALGLLSVADMVIAEQKSSFSLSEARLGLAPACIGLFLTAKVGISWMRAWCMTAKVFDENEALTAGLIHEIVSKEQIPEKIKQWARGVLLCAPQALSQAKKMLNLFSLADQAHLDQMAVLLAKMRKGSEAQEGISAFFEKRPALW